MHRENLELLLSLANERVEAKDSTQVERIEQRYAKLLGEWSSDGMKGNPRVLESLRTHIVGRIESIINASGQLFDEILLWKVRGIWQIVLRPIGVTYRSGGRDYFAMRFVFSGRYKCARGSLQKEKELIDARLTELLLSLGLKPSRFLKCDECGAYFYQTTSREKNYCSARCSARVRKRRFLKKAKPTEGGEVQD
jgi:hypothetical protein